MLNGNIMKRLSYNRKVDKIHNYQLYLNGGQWHNQGGYWYGTDPFNPFHFPTNFAAGQVSCVTDPTWYITRITVVQEDC